VPASAVGSAAPTLPARRRADAERNRTAIIEAAADAFLQDGGNVSLEEIARRAGVGSATLHRHFASRQTLLAAVFEQVVSALCAAAVEIAGAYAPARALPEWLALIGRHCAQNNALTALVQVAPGQLSPQRQTYEELERAGNPLLQGALAVGAVRTDVTLTELLALTNGVAAACSGRPDDVDRLFGLVWDGVRAGNNALD
jgi:AcrR family transcriptional regulator